MDQRKYPIPVIKEDGSLLFKSVAPVLPGYHHHPDNVKLLVPDSVPCTERITLPVLSRGGKYSVMNRCNHVTCEMRGAEVNAEICQACPLRVKPGEKSVVLERLKGQIPQLPSVDSTPPSQ